MSRFLAAGGAFLLGVLWMDLLFDAQLFSHLGSPGSLPEPVLASVAAYYRRVTTEAAPLGHLVGAVMIATVAGAGLDLLRGRRSVAVRLLAFVLCTAPVGLALARILPDAVALGARDGTIAAQSDLARTILHAHVACFASMAAFVAIQMADRGGRTRPRTDAPATS